MTEHRRPAQIDFITARHGAINVVAPPEHQGVVNALRAAFAPCKSTVPDDMAMLLDRLSEAGHA